MFRGDELFSSVLLAVLVNASGRSLGMQGKNGLNFVNKLRHAVAFSESIQRVTLTVSLGTAGHDFRPLPKILNKHHHRLGIPNRINQPSISRRRGMNFND